MTGPLHRDALNAVITFHSQKEKLLMRVKILTLCWPRNLSNHHVFFTDQMLQIIVGDDKATSKKYKIRVNMVNTH